MITKSTLKSAIAALALVTTAGYANAESAFSTLAGIPAEPMNSAEMEATQGRFFIDPLSGNLWDFFGNVYVQDQASGLFVDANGLAFQFAYLGAEDEPYNPALGLLVDETGQSGVVAFNMFGTAILPDGTVTDVFGNVVGSLSPGS